MMKHASTLMQIMHHNTRDTMLSRLITALLVVVLVGVAGGFVVLASWDVPVKQTPVEKPLDNSHFLEKNT
jgi:hypothetical protein